MLSVLKQLNVEAGLIRAVSASVRSRLWSRVAVVMFAEQSQAYCDIVAVCRSSGGRQEDAQPQ